MHLKGRKHEICVRHSPLLCFLAQPFKRTKNISSRQPRAQILKNRVGHGNHQAKIQPNRSHKQCFLSGVGKAPVLPKATTNGVASGLRPPAHHLIGQHDNGMQAAGTWPIPIISCCVNSATTPTAPTTSTTTTAISATTTSTTTTNDPGRSKHCAHYRA